MFIDESLNYHILEKKSNEGFQALWIKISFDKKQNIGKYRKEYTH